MKRTQIILDRKERFRQIDSDNLLCGDFRDIPAKTKVKVVEYKQGMYLLEHEGFYARVWASFVSKT